MAKGFVYTTAFIDVFSSKIVGWTINKMCIQLCLCALKDVIHRYGKPEMINSYLGSVCTSIAWTDNLKKEGIRISMDSKG